MTKWLITRSGNAGPKWRFMEFGGTSGAESRGIVDILAIRKDHRREEVGMKRGDCFEMIFIQTKGGSAPRPKEADVARLSRLAQLYNAKDVVLAEWKKGRHLQLYRLVDGEWIPATAKQIFGKTRKPTRPQIQQRGMMPARCHSAPRPAAHPAEERQGGGPPNRALTSPAPRPILRANMDHLHAYWRMEYIEAPRLPAGADPFAELPRLGNDAEALIIHRSRRSYLILNRYPYNPGHLLAVPFRAATDLTALTAAERADLMDEIVLGKEILKAGIKPHGFNIGFNLGSAAGGSIPHLHAHIVPRWNGDTNFMPVLGQTRVLPQSLAAMFQRLKQTADRLSRKKRK